MVNKHHYQIVDKLITINDEYLFELMAFGEFAFRLLCIKRNARIT